MDGGIVHEKDDTPFPHVLAGLGPCLEKVELEDAGVDSAFHNPGSKHAIGGQGRQHGDGVGTGTVEDGAGEKAVLVLGVSVSIGLLSGGPIIVKR